MNKNLCKTDVFYLFSSTKLILLLAPPEVAELGDLILEIELGFFVEECTELVTDLLLITLVFFIDFYIEDD